MSTSHFFINNELCRIGILDLTVPDNFNFMFFCKKHYLIYKQNTFNQVTIMFLRTTIGLVNYLYIDPGHLNAIFYNTNWQDRQDYYLVMEKFWKSNILASDLKKMILDHLSKINYNNADLIHALIKFRFLNKIIARHLFYNVLSSSSTSSHNIYTKWKDLHRPFSSTTYNNTIIKKNFGIVDSYNETLLTYSIKATPPSNSRSCSFITNTKNNQDRGDDCSINTLKIDSLNVLFWKQCFITMVKEHIQSQIHNVYLSDLTTKKYNRLMAAAESTTVSTFLNMYKFTVHCVRARVPSIIDEQSDEYL